MHESGFCMKQCVLMSFSVKRKTCVIELADQNLSPNCGLVTGWPMIITKHSSRNARARILFMKQIIIHYIPSCIENHYVMTDLLTGKPVCWWPWCCPVSCVAQWMKPVYAGPTEITADGFMLHYPHSASAHQYLLYIPSPYQYFGCCWFFAIYIILRVLIISWYHKVYQFHTKW